MAEETTELILKFLGGSKEACTRIISRFYGAVYNLCYCILNDKNEVEDAVQETFLKMIKNIAQYNTNSKFTPWLFQIAVNTARNIRIKKRPESLPREETIMATDIKFNPIDVITREEEISKIATVIEELSPKLKVIMLLKYQQDLENDEIAKVLDISPETLRVRLFRALNIIREKMKAGPE